MKKNIFFALILLSLVGCVSSKNPLKELNSSLKSLIQPKSEWSDYPLYVLEKRNKAFKKLNLDLKNHKKVAIIEELDPFLDSRIISEIFYFGVKKPIKYQTKDNDYIFTEQQISGISAILPFIEKNNLEELVKLANEKSKKISDGSWIFISIYTNGISTTYLIPQFEIN